MTKKVWEEMTSNLITIGWNDSTEHAYNRMHTTRVRHLPVLDDNGKVVGILSDRDVQRSMISQIDCPSRQSMSDETIEFDPESRVRDYMTWPAKSVDRYTDLRIVAERMVAEKISSFLVTDKDQMLGIVTTEDLLKVLVQLLAEPNRAKNWTLAHLFDERDDGVMQSYG